VCGADGDLAGAAIHQHGQVEFANDVAARFHINAFHNFSGGTGLNGDQRVADHLTGEFFDFGHRLRQPHAAFVTGGFFFELAFAAATRVNLRFHDERRFAQTLGYLLGFGGGIGHAAIKDGHTELFQKLFGLVLMDIHAARLPCSRPKRRAWTWPQRAIPWPRKDLWGLGGSILEPL